MRQLKLAARLNKEIPKCFRGIPDRKVIKLAETYRDEVLDLVGIDLSIIKDNMSESDEGIQKIGRRIICNAVRVSQKIKEANEAMPPPAA